MQNFSSRYLMERFSERCPGQFESKNFGISRINYLMINRKWNCENEVSSRKLAVLKNRIFWKCNSSEKV